MFKSLSRLSVPLTTTLARRSAQPCAYPYFVPRNTRGNLPVYTDIRNAGTRYLIHVRNVDGNAHLLAKDLGDSLFVKESAEAQRMKIELLRGKTLVITGGHWKKHVMEWLKANGF